MDPITTRVQTIPTIVTVVPTYRYTDTVFCEIMRSYIKITSPKEKAVPHERAYIVPYTLHVIACKAPVKSIFSTVFVLCCTSNAEALMMKILSRTSMLGIVYHILRYNVKSATRCELHRARFTQL